jgi:hypothetical protein
LTFAEANLHLFGGQGHASAALKNLHTSLRFGSYFLRQPCPPAPRASFLPLQRPNEASAEKAENKIYSLKNLKKKLWKSQEDW